MTIQEIQEEIVNEFSMFDDWMQRYEYIIELGKSLPLIKDANLKFGCTVKRTMEKLSLLQIAMPF